MFYVGARAAPLASAPMHTHERAFVCSLVYLCEYVRACVRVCVCVRGQASFQLLDPLVKGWSVCVRGRESTPTGTIPVQLPRGDA